MKRPSFQFYPADHSSNSKLRRCTWGARGAWMDVLCLLHGSDEYGVLRWPLSEIAHALGAPVALLEELSQKGVLKGSDTAHDAYIHTPRHANKDGEPVELVGASAGPCWYSSRLVRDEWLRQRRGAGTRFDSDNQPPSRSPTRSPIRRVGERQGDGASSSSPPPSPKQSTPGPRRRGTTDRFDEFWTLWPKNERKQDKGKCSDQWARHDLDAIADTILVDIRTKLGTQKWRDGFIEAPLVFLRNKRWEDGVTPDEPRQPHGRAAPSGRAMVHDAEETTAAMDALYNTPPASREVVEAAMARLGRLKTMKTIGSAP